MSSKFDTMIGTISLYHILKHFQIGTVSMNFHRWIIALAIGWFASFTQAQENPENVDSPLKNPAFSVPIRVIEDVETKANRDNREIEGLVAQQQMAEATIELNAATQSMKKASWWSLGLVAVGTLLLVKTLTLTREANAAARKAVEVTEAVGRIQTQAYVHLDAARVTIGTLQTAVSGRKSDKVFYVIMDVRNSGNTPCKWYECEGVVEVAERTEDGANVIRQYPIAVQRWHSLPPNSNRTFELKAEGIKIFSVFDHVMNLEHGLFRISGVARCETEFGDVKETPFRCFAERNDLGQGMYIASRGLTSNGESWSKTMYQSTYKAEA